MNLNSLNLKIIIGTIYLAIISIGLYFLFSIIDLNDLMSYGSHRLWKKILVEMMNIQNNHTIIDVGSGTGDLIQIMQRKKSNLSITSIDLNIEMLNESKKKFSNNLKSKSGFGILCNFNFFKLILTKLLIV